MCLEARRGITGSCCAALFLSKLPGWRRWLLAAHCTVSAATAWAAFVETWFWLDRTHHLLWMRIGRTAPPSQSGSAAAAQSAPAATPSSQIESDACIERLQRPPGVASSRDRLATAASSRLQQQQPARGAASSRAPWALVTVAAAAAAAAVVALAAGAAAGVAALGAVAVAVGRHAAGAAAAGAVVAAVAACRSVGA